MNKKMIRARFGWCDVAALTNGRIYEVKSTYILQPGPAALIEGVRQLHAILARVAGSDVAPELPRTEKMDSALLL